MIPPRAANELRYQLLEIPDLCTQAYEDLQPSSNRATGMPSGTRTPPLPVREDILSLLGPAAAGDVHDPYGDQSGPVPAATVLSSWCEVIWGYPCRSIPTACRLLLDNHRVACEADYAQDYAHEIRGLYRTLTGLARTYSPPLALRCPRCTQYSLVTDPGAGYRCIDPDCTTILTPDLYDHLAQTETDTLIHLHNAS